MNCEPKPRVYKTQDPFDNTADARLLNMGILQSDGTANPETMLAFTDIFSGLFYADLKDFYDPESGNGISTVYDTFSALHAKGRYRHMYLLYSAQYDCFKKPMPDPVWWIAGSPELITLFMDGLMKRFRELYNASPLADDK